MKSIIIIYIVFLYVINFADSAINIRRYEITPATVCKNMLVVLNGDSKYCGDESLELKNDKCNYCLEIVTIIRDEMSNYNTRAMIKTTIEIICLTLPLSKPCLYFTKEYTDLVFDMIRKNMNPDSICKSLMFCDKEISFKTCSNASLDQSYPVMKLNPRNIINVLCRVFTNEDIDTVKCYDLILSDPQTLSDLIDEHIIKKEYCFNYSMIKSDAADECEMCKVLLKNLRNVLINNRSLDEFKTVAEKVCLQILKNDHICHHDLDEYFELLYKTLQEESIVDTICIAIDLCHKNQSHDVHKLKRAYEKFIKSNTLIFDENILDFFYLYYTSLIIMP